MTHPQCWLRADDVELDFRGVDKRTTLAALARRLAARAGASSQEVFDALWDRETLGSTGLGHGVALPHARLAGLGHPIAAFLRLNRAIDFDAPDGKPVDLVLGLLMQRNEPQRQLDLLARFAGLLSDPRFREQIARADNPETVARLFERGLDP
jgi:PTS system nitrogen regulatory IIA component